ncbi:hypothetical protein SAMD00019534_085760 [Acytostelium subglobosum LB1]|uniref:hypothetical protein n=1 Tax=Acytostelium subglobosum LB1 TaxID=1410327 RepID=UPI0006450834|nr:hypothetical protein SAMD00019534_085760 [Acytostelium subglobosum LB1]GAM25401.1 hypothetical protein SAMD00019534_085760 [Acytostelium subglobosum LB1]|eukprot:XP_012751921.1 hypothetical protein SAMD00019534_085760 [Acytostelium subglobosum LB1]
MELNTHLTQLADSINRENGQLMADHLSLSEIISLTIEHESTVPSMHSRTTQQEIAFNNKMSLLKKMDNVIKRTVDLDSFVQNKMHLALDAETRRSYHEMTVSRLRAVSSIFDGRYTDAFKHLSDAITAFLKVFEVWSTPVMWKLTYNIRIMAKLVNAAPSSSTTTTTPGSGGSSERKIDPFEEASRLLNRCFQSSGADRATDLELSKKRAAMGIVNQLFQIYFKLNNLKLCKNLTKTIESKLYPALDTYPIKQCITYRFFVGRLAAFDGDFVKAREFLLFSFNQCPSDNQKNKRLILLYLIPMQLSQCIFPKQSLLIKHGLHQFVGIVKGMKTGDIKQFNECLSSNQNYFIQKGIYLIIEKLKNIVYRNLFKKIYLINGNARVPIGHFVTALKWAENETVDVDEAECIISNLIYNGYIKGYISHKVGLVLSPTNPFPAFWK